MELQDISEFVRLSKDALDLMKSAYKLIPKGENTAEIEKRLAAADELMKRADAKLASDLNYHLCQCQFPPSIMLWHERQKSYVCMNSACGRTIKTGPINYGPVKADYF